MTHTEDDTFNALKRTPIREMKRLVIEFHISPSSPGEDYTTGLQKLFDKNFWTREEYHSEWTKLQKGDM